MFDLIRYRRQDHAVTLCAFDLIELDGEDLRREPIKVCKRTLKGLLRRAHPGIVFNQHFDVEVLSSSSRPAPSAARALCRSALVHPIDRAGRIAGSRSRIRLPRL